MNIAVIFTTFVFADLACGHVPEFLGCDAEVTIPSSGEESHIYYIKQKCTQVTIIFKNPASQDEPKTTLVAPAAGSYAASSSQSSVTCTCFDANDNQVSQTDIDVYNGGGSKGEPWTQTSYYESDDLSKELGVGCFKAVITPKLPSISSYDFNIGVAVGGSENLGADTLIQYPVILARLHGSWWTGEYVFQYCFVLGLVYFFCCCVWIYKNRTLSNIVARLLLFAAAAAYFAAFIDVVWHTGINSLEGSAAAIAIIAIALTGCLVWTAIFTSVAVYYDHYIEYFTKDIFALILVASGSLLLLLFGGGWYLGSAFVIISGVSTIFSDNPSPRTRNVSYPAVLSSNV